MRVVASLQEIQLMLALFAASLMEWGGEAGAEDQGKKRSTEEPEDAPRKKKRDEDKPRNDAPH